MIKREFKLNKKILSEEFMLPKNKEKRQWYFSTFSSTIIEMYKILYYSTLKRLEKHIYFFNWFEDYCQKENIINTFIKKLDESLGQKIQNYLKVKKKRIKILSIIPLNLKR